MRILSFLIAPANAPFYLAESPKRIPIAAKENAADAIVTTAVMSLVGEEIIYGNNITTASIIVITMDDAISSNRDDEEDAAGIVAGDFPNDVAQLSVILRQQLEATADEKLYKNEIWTKVQRVDIDAPDQVVVHKIRYDIEQALADLLDAEQYDDEGPEPLFDAEAFKELPVGAKLKDYKLGLEQL